METPFLSTSEARKQLGEMVSQVNYQNKTFAIGRHGKIEAYLVPANKRGVSSNPINLLSEKSIAPLIKKYKLDLLVLFGSYAKGRQKRGSDIDLAYQSKKPLNWKDQNSLYNDLIKLMEREDIDLVNLNECHDITLKHQIFSEGKVIFLEKGLNYHQLKNRYFFEYQNFIPFTKKESDLMNKKLDRLLKLNL